MKNFGEEGRGGDFAWNSGERDSYGGRDFWKGVFLLRILLIQEIPAFNRRTC